VLQKARGFLKRYVRDLEEVLIRTLEEFSIKACRDLLQVGVWVNQKKIGAIGLTIRKGVTMHGFASMSALIWNTSRLSILAASKTGKPLPCRSSSGSNLPWKK
jgi:hypothetical protein